VSRPTFFFFKKPDLNNGKNIKSYKKLSACEMTFYMYLQKMFIEKGFLGS
jgi:hypothetical protein